MGFFDIFRRHKQPEPTPVSISIPHPPQIPITNPASLTPITSGRVLLIHGYSATGEDLIPWRDMLCSKGVNPVPVEVGNYITLNNEVTIKDLGEAFDRALRLTPWSSGTKDDTFTFDAIVHSTGMLVLRQWLTSDPFLGVLDSNGNPDPRSRIRRLKHLVGLAPATFGSPQAKQGRSWLGALVKGSKQLGPDFLNAGDRVLSGLELASSYTWDLAHKDMICPSPLYTMGADTPYATIFIGNTPYDGLSAVANSPGCDGTVRWAGCALNTRKVSIDLRREPRLRDATNSPTRCNMTPWVDGRLAAPMTAVNGKNHGTIVSEPDPTVCDLLIDFLRVSNAAACTAWQASADDFSAQGLPKMNQESADGDFGGAGWQQLVVHLVDDHLDGVTDYNLQFFLGDSLDQSDVQPGASAPEVAPIPVLVDTFSGDASYRCFYIRLSPEMLSLNQPGQPPKKLWIELIASSGSALLEYEAYTGAGPSQPSQSESQSHSLTISHLGGKPAKLDITKLAQGDETLLFPYTTTLLEIFVEREPLPLNTVSQLFNFIQ